MTCPATRSTSPTEAGVGLPRSRVLLAGSGCQTQLSSLPHQQGTSEGKVPTPNVAASRPRRKPAWASRFVTSPSAPHFLIPMCAWLTEFWGVTSETTQYVTRSEQCLAHTGQCQLRELVSLPRRLPNFPNNPVPSWLPRGLVHTQTPQARGS